MFQTSSQSSLERCLRRKSLVEDMHRTTAPSLDAPPVADALAVKFAETFQPAHFFTRLELFHADRAFLLFALAVHAVFFRSNVGEDAAGAIRHCACAGDGGWGCICW